MRTPFLILFTILSVLMLLAVACGSDEADPEATDTPAPPNTVPAASRTPEPTGDAKADLGADEDATSRCCHHWAVRGRRCSTLMCLETPWRSTPTGCRYRLDQRLW